MEVRSTWVVWLLLFAQANAQTCDYCSISSQHSLCRFTGTQSTCSGLQKRGVSSTESQIIVDQHNQLRARVANGKETRGYPGPQPPATNMQALTWSAELAKIAQAWADQCTFDHDCSSCRATCAFSVGQNMYTEGTSRALTANWTKATVSWYDEVKQFSPTKIKPFASSSGTGHYTQVVWASTKFIGCGYTQYLDGGYNTGLYVCNYGPAGNMIGGEMYAKGTACSACPSGTSCSTKYPGLCAGSSTSGSTVAAQPPPDTGTGGVKPPKPQTGTGGTSPMVETGGVPSGQPDVGSQQTVFVCHPGDNECNFQATGCTWNTMPTTRPGSDSENYLETSVRSGEFADFSITDSIRPAIGSPMCFIFHVFKKVTMPNCSSFFQLLLARSNPLLLAINIPQETPLVVPLPDTIATYNPGWFEARLTFSGISKPFKLSLKQSGPTPINGDKSPVVRLGVDSIRIMEGKCPPLTG